ncbi:MAG: Fic family protein [Candidatus Brennerbacteria bacterium]|nr:Fic family protein [Candidatus Brennerbacteria bacterium]
MNKKELKNNQLNKRQDYIMRLFEKQETFSISIGMLGKYINEALGHVSKITLNRDLKRLLEFGYIIAKGKTRATVYTLSPRYQIIRTINPEEYFKTKTDERSVKEHFDFEIFSHLTDIFTSEEQQYLKTLNDIYKTNIKKHNKNSLKKEFERLTIELSWKSSEIEGNTYTLLETEALILNKQEAPGHNKKEVIMILNHKAALDYIQNNAKQFKKISLREIKNIHNILTMKLGIKRGLRSSVVGIVGTKYKPLDNIYQIQEAMEKMERTVNSESDPFAKAIIFMALIAYIQPFEDGNKRTSRLFGNAILMAQDYCPLSYRSVNEGEYKKAVILFYEQGNIAYFKKLFIEQFEFAVKNYFR